MTSFALWPLTYFAHWKSVEICLRASMGMVEPVWAWWLREKFLSLRF